MPHQGRVLVIDDAEGIRSFIASALRLLDYDTATASDGEQGLAHFGSGVGWDLILLDHRMPHATGLEVLREMRQRDPLVRIIMMTAYDTLDLVVDAMQSGAVNFLRKPFSLETLAGAVESALAKAAPSVTAATLAATPETRHDFPFLGFRLINGFQFWPAALSTAAPVTEAVTGHIERAFEVRLPSGATQRCVVVLDTLRDLVQQTTGRAPPPPDQIWDTACANALANYLWQKSEVPSNVLAATDLSVEQLEMLLSSATIA